MTMTLENQPRLGAFDHMSSYSNTPHFTNPWASGHGAQHGSQGMYSQSMGAGMGGLDSVKQQAPRPTPSTSMASYGSIPVTAASSADLMSLNRMQTTSAPYGEPSYATATAPSPVNASYAASPSSYDGLPGYAAAPMRSTFALAPEADSRRALQNDDRRSFADAIDAGQGMLAMSQETPRAIYPPNNRSRGSGDYGFPATHSTSSSISSQSNYGSGYYGGSIDASSVSDYSTAGSDIESVASRTLPRPNLMTQPPPAPQSMMGQFSCKVSSRTQKKHKCKVCDKRFTRPSSLQTHMYSHTGEKPFCCEVEGCGRHFSVVSNLRRHRKVHKNDSKSDAGSEDPNDDTSD